MFLSTYSSAAGGCNEDEPDATTRHQLTAGSLLSLWPASQRGLSLLWQVLLPPTRRAGNAALPEALAHYHSCGAGRDIAVDRGDAIGGRHEIPAVGGAAQPARGVLLRRDPVPKLLEPNQALQQTAGAR